MNESLLNLSERNQMMIVFDSGMACLWGKTLGQTDSFEQELSLFSILVCVYSNFRVQNRQNTDNMRIHMI